MSQPPFMNHLKKILEDGDAHVNEVRLVLPDVVEVINVVALIHVSHIRLTR